jgi:hypothetical protein
MSASGGGAGFSWQQVDQKLVSLIIAEVSEEFLQLAHDDLAHINYQTSVTGTAGLYRCSGSRCIAYALMS